VIDKHNIQILAELGAEALDESLLAGRERAVRAGHNVNSCNRIITIPDAIGSEIRGNDN
jgi:hypothetical protein